MLNWKTFHVGVYALDDHPIRGLSGLVQVVGFPWVSGHFRKEKGKHGTESFHNYDGDGNVRLAKRMVCHSML
jgi:hypothetical protein